VFKRKNQEKISGGLFWLRDVEGGRTMERLLQKAMKIKKGRIWNI
jgi:hypothetical protein